MTPPDDTATDPVASPFPFQTLLWIGALALFIFLFGLWDGPLAKTEGHRAITAHQMAEGGDWVVPHLFDRVYRRKPPLHYWVIACSETLFGANEFAWRLPSALAAVALCLVIWGFTRNWFGDEAAVAAAMAYLSVIWLWSQSRNADIDSMNTLASVTACLCAIHIGFGGGRRWPVTAINLLACVAMMLLKGPVGLMAYGGALLGAAIANRTWRWWARPGIWAPPLAGGAALWGWKMALESRLSDAGVVAADTATSELLGRITPNLNNLTNMAMAMGGLMLLTLPLSLVLLRSIRHPVQAAMAPATFRAIQGAVIGSIGLCILFMVGRPRYGYIILPLLCPLAGAAIAAWQRGSLEEQGKKRMRQGLTMSGIFLSGLCLWAPIHEFKLVDRFNFALMALSVMAVGLFANLFLKLQRRDIQSSLWCLAFLLLPVASMSYARIKSIDRHHQSGHQAAQIIRRHVQAIDPHAILWSGEIARNHPELVFYTGMSVRRPPALPTHVDRINVFELEATLSEGKPKWLVLSGVEWQKFQKLYPTAFTHALKISDTHPELDQPMVVFFKGHAP